MPTLTGGSIAIDMNDTLPWNTFLSSVATGANSSTHFTTANGSSVYSYTGTGFSGYQGGIPTAGTITAISLTVGATFDYTLSGLSLSIPTLFTYINNNDPTGLYTSIFQGNDSITGSTQSDTLLGFAGNDTLNGSAGNDTLVGGVGNDALDGGTGEDRASYGDATSGVTVSLAIASQQNTIGAGLDTLSNIEDLIGSTHNDVLTGNSGSNLIDGNTGADQMTGGAGNDDYYVDVAGDSVIESANEGTDRVNSLVSFVLGANIENLTLIGANAANATGNALDNVLLGNSGDNIFAGGGGNDTMDGGLGLDTLTFAAAAAGVTISLANNAQQNSIGYGLYTISNIEDLIGSAFADTLTGDGGDNIIDGGGGADQMSGGSGDDSYVADDANDVASEASNGGLDTVSSTATFSLGANLENLTLTGSAAINGAGNELANVIIGNSGDNILTPGAGVDYVNGGAGVDTLDYSGCAGSVQIDFRVNSAKESGEASPDGFTNMENAIGSAFNDIFFAGAGANNFFGGAGDDTFRNGGAADVFDGGDGVDRLVLDASSSVSNTTISVNDLIGNTSNALADGSAVHNMETFDLTLGSGADNLVVDHVLSGTDSIAGGAGLDRITADFSYLTTRLDITSVDIEAQGFALSFSSIEEFDVTGGSGDDFLFGGVGNSVLHGGAGNDFLQGGPGFFDGGAGNDTLNGVLGVTRVDGGSGVDRAGMLVNGGFTSYNITFSAHVELGDADIDNAETFYFGFAGGNDSLTLTPDYFVGDNTYDGSAGLHDRLVFDATGYSAQLNVGLVKPYIPTETLGFNGATLHFMNVEEFYVTGGAGDDTIGGGTGDDVLNGGDGADLLAGRQGNNIIHGGAGNDELHGYDVLMSGGIYAGNNQLYGDAGNDTVGGGDGNDVVDGGDGDDTIGGGEGADQLNGGDGDDAIYFDASDTLVSGGAGYDIARVAFGSPGAVLNLTAGQIEAAVGYGVINGIGDDIFTAAGATWSVNLQGGLGDDLLVGGLMNDTLDGGGGVDTMDGGAGADTMIGGLGDDTYIVDNGGDVVTENASAGTDTIRSSVGVAALAANVENLVLLGTAVTGNGNALNNAITGNAANNFINGMAGADAMAGGLGDDTYFVDNAGDVVTENSGEGTDIIFSTISLTLAQNVENLTLNGAALNATGNFLNNTLTGDAQKNTLNGGSGEDTLAGGLDSDTYIYNSAGDVITEAANAGLADTVLAFIDVGALMANVETVTLAGSATSAVGNELNNVLSGNALANTLTGGLGNDTLSGGVGADAMIGGQGDDAYLVENVGDGVTENASEGNDVVYTWVSLPSLFDNVERATIIGAGNLDLAGNGLDNRLYGNDNNNTLNGGDGADILGGLGGDDHLIGGAGRDLLTGGAGNDAFVYQAITDSGTTGAARDIINDFTQGQDTIDVSAIDADSISGGQQQFAFLGTGAFSNTAGELRYDLIDNASGTDYTIISLDTDGDGVADSQITLVGLVTLTQNDFVFGP